MVSSHGQTLPHAVSLNYIVIQSPQLHLQLKEIIQTVQHILVMASAALHSAYAAMFGKHKTE